MIRYAALILLALSAWFAFSSMVGLSYGVDLVAAGAITMGVTYATRKTTP